ncbi:cobalt ECF transporter T component CbiQ [bacterium]|nr:cobalt ECF transporter T component CbiQ [bacterium]
MHLHLPEIDEFAHLNSPIHSWDARVKIISLLCLIISIVLLDKILPALFGLFFCIILVFISRIPLRFLFAYLRWAILFSLFFVIIMPLTVEGDEIAKFYFLSISRNGIELGFLIALRALSAVLLIFPMVGTSKFIVTMKALQDLKIPDKLIQMVMFSYRYIFIFIEEVERMFTAAKARAFHEKTNLHTLRTVGFILGMLFVRSYERAKRVYDAMLARGYTGELKIIHEFDLGSIDFVKGFIIIVVAILLQVTGYLL